ncbi:hypothetical protein ACP4OV_004894 [Aristida adscensionis]
MFLRGMKVAGGCRLPAGPSSNADMSEMARGFGSWWIYLGFQRYTVRSVLRLESRRGHACYS